MPFCFLRSGSRPSTRRFIWISCAVWSCDCQQPNTELGAGARLIGLLFECFYLLREQGGKDVLIGHPLLCFCFLLAIGDRLLRVSTPPTTHNIRSHGTYVYPILLEPCDHRFRLMRRLDVYGLHHSDKPFSCCNGCDVERSLVGYSYYYPYHHH